MINLNEPAQVDIRLTPCCAAGQRNAEQAYAASSPSAPAKVRALATGNQ